MKNILIVEDDKIMRRGFRSMIQKSGVPIEVILECGNGEQALEVLKEQEIDVMFTDIRMPVMDGLELVKEIQKLETKPLVVVVSGCDDFSYAVEMLRNGVRDYFLKPIEEEKIKEIMVKLSREIDSRDENSKTDKKFGEQQLKLLLNNQSISDNDIELLKARYDNFFHQGGYVCCVVGKNNEIIDNGKFILLKDVESSNVCFVEERQLTPFINNIIYDMATGISRVHYGIEDIKASYDEAVAARERAFCSGRIIYADEMIKEAPQALIESAEKHIEEQACMQRLQIIGTSKTDELADIWEKFFYEVQRGRINFSEFTNVMDSFVADVVNIYRNAISEEHETDLEKFKEIIAFSDIFEYKNELMDFIVDLHNVINNQESANRGQQKMKLAIEYINDNYNKDLNMAVVSNYVSMNYSLFSFSFKQYTGSNFVNYIKEIRIREAKRLLEDTDMKVIDISQAVGYENEKHFMKLFKNVCGVSPSEYRKNMQKG